MKTGLLGGALCAFLTIAPEPAIAQDGMSLSPPTLRYEAVPSADGGMALIPLDETTEQVTGAVSAVDPGEELPEADATALTEEQSRSVASQTARMLMDHALDSACGLEHLPETVTPSVSVSFSFLAGGTLGVEAEWNVDELCAR